MAGISLLSSVGHAVGRTIARSTNLRAIKNSDKKFFLDKDKALGAATVLSIILKDGIGCAMYVTQSWNNKKIPEKKRKFVSALDLTNGVLMILAQIGMFFAMRKYSGPLFNKMFSKSFDAVARSNMLGRLRMNRTKARIVNPDLPIIRTLDSSKEYDKVKKIGSGLFEFVANTAAATIIGKRVIVPLIATPAASRVEKWMNKHMNMSEEGNNEPTMTGNPENSQQSSQTLKPNNWTSSTNLLDRVRQQQGNITA